MNNVRKNNFQSPVPKFTFSKDLDEQKIELQNNSIIERFSLSRKNLSKDIHRPIYHFVSPESTMNDPNGLCFWNGYWHLFYQGYPVEFPDKRIEGTNTRVHWGHAYSKDLINWKDLPYAIYPDPEESCFSGATLVEDNRVIAMYHGTQAGNMIAISDDSLLLNWDKLTGKPVIPILQPDGKEWPYRVFDPCIWKKNGTYFSLSGGTLPHAPTGKRTRANFLFKSNDLINWEYLHPFVEGDRFTLIGDDGACPYFWPIGDRYILMFFSHMSGGQALIGDYDKDRDKFIVTAHHDFNFGAFGPAGVHAPSATPDGEGGVISIFNMNPGMHNQGWDQIMSLPRRLTILGNNKFERNMLKIEPAGNIKSLRYDHEVIKNFILEANKDVIFNKINGNAIEIFCEIKIKDSPMVEMNILRSPKKEEFTRIIFYPNRGYRDWDRYDKWEPKSRLEASSGLISIDSSYSSTLPSVLSRSPETGPVFLEPNENLRINVFIDKSVVEVFVNDKQCLAVRVYPGRQDSTGVSLRSQGTSSEIIKLESWRMKSIY